MSNDCYIVLAGAHVELARHVVGRQRRAER